MEIFRIIIFGLPALLVAFTIHEYAHGYVAYILGDPTAKYQGRLTLNPIKHIDPFGAFILIYLLIVTHGRFCIGWGKPVPIDPRYLKDPRRDTMLIALAGPLSNFALAFLLGLIIRFGFISPYSFLGGFILINIGMNTGLGIFNLIPCPPLDGWKVLYGVLPAETAYNLMRIEMLYGIYISLFFIFLLFLGILNPILGPIYFFLFGLFTGAI